jgi:uncharacterized membrane protein YhaH (DUF805 family)
MPPIASGFFLANLINLLLIAVWVAAMAVAFLRLRHAEMDDVARALWAALILFVPILGALAFLIINSGQSNLKQTGA